jgi:nucleotide-binding universal stress UspA family protein
MPMASEVHSTSARQAVLSRRRILLCYDGSAEARRALERVGEIASVVPCRVAVISVAEPIYPNPPYTGYADPGEEQAHRRLLEDSAEDLRGQGVDTTTLEPVGDPAAAILDTARRRRPRRCRLPSPRADQTPALPLGECRGYRRGAVRRAGRALRRYD